MLHLITSGAYIGQELAAEFGLLPPAFLPVGTQRLYEYQARIGEGASVFLTVPESYQVREQDASRLSELGITLLPVPDGLTLGDALIYSLNFIGGPDQPLTILHGDTLLASTETNGTGDFIAIGEFGDGYSWAGVDVADGMVRSLETTNAGGDNGRREFVACGYFGFSSSTLLVRAITRARGDFIRGLNLYNTERPFYTQIVKSWLDFGHLQTFFRSRRMVTTARAFNTLRIDAFTARKSGEDHEKIRAEAEWLRNVPPSVQVYSARMIDAGDAEGLPFYETEYEYMPTLSELYVFGALGRQTWGRIVASCQEFLDACAKCMGPGPSDTNLETLSRAKTVERLDQFARETNFDIDRETAFEGIKLPTLRKIAEITAGMVSQDSARQETVMHGDFCFSNILYNSRVQRIKVIDPRGYIISGHRTTFGDSRYDLAKLSHSVLGRYDQIIAGQYRVAPFRGYDFSIAFPSQIQQKWLEGALVDLNVGGVSAASSEIRAITVGLFLSMLPLHADRPDRQHAFIANALRLFASLEVGSR